MKFLAFPLWLLFVLPGKIFAYVNYFFPGRGQVASSARQKNSTFAHVMISITFWVLLILYGQHYMR